jgi:hypothetical protein
MDGSPYLSPLWGGSARSAGVGVNAPTMLSITPIKF